MITLVHYNNNDLGDIMWGWGGGQPPPRNNGLSGAGYKVVERMQELGMVVDVAHAHPITLKQVAAMASRPLVDSHTSLCPTEGLEVCGRFHSWKDMERIT